MNKSLKKLNKPKAAAPKKVTKKATRKTATKKVAVKTAMARSMSTTAQRPAFNPQILPKAPKFSQKSLSLHSTPSRHMSHALSQHLDTPYNNANTKFEFTPESMEKIQKVLKKFPENYKQSAVMPVLFIAQEQNDNWLPLVAMDKVAELLDMPKMRVYEVATFYTMYNRDKVGKFHIQVCGTTTCMTMGARDIKKAAKKFAGVDHDGVVSKDGNFCIVEVECLGACTNAPMIQVNNHEFYENLTTDTIVDVMKGLLNGTAKPGPQNGQRVAEGPHGKTTLHNYTDSFPKFNLERIETKLAEMKAAAGAPPAAAAAAPAPKVEEKKVEAPKAAAPVPPAPKVEEKKADAAPAAAAPAPKVEEKKADAAPAAAAPVAPKVEEKKAEEVVVEKKTTKKAAAAPAAPAEEKPVKEKKTAAKKA